MSDELVLYVRGTAADFERLFRTVETSGVVTLEDDGPGQARIGSLRPRLWKPGTVTPLIKRQVQP